MDAGEYSCIATNMMGAIYSTFNICVEGDQFNKSVSSSEKELLFSYFSLILAMTEPDSASSELEERSANVSDVDMNNVSH